MDYETLRLEIAAGIATITLGRKDNPANALNARMAVGTVALMCCLILLVLMIRLPEGDVIFADKEIAGEDADAPYGLWGTLAWFAALITATWFVGFILALFGFLVTFFRIRAGAGWGKTLILTIAGIGFMCLMAGALNRDFPPGLLQATVDLPWPLK